MPVTPPDLSNPNLFERRPGVPILDVHTRNGRTVDVNRLKLVAANSNKRAAAGELGLLLLGHTTDEGKESDQPELVGYARNYQLGKWDGRDCIMADLFYDTGKAQQAFTYPRRSVEVYYDDTNPANNYVDAVALLRRTPARDLGLLTYARKDLVKERYAMADSTASASTAITMDNLDDFETFVKSNNLREPVIAVGSFLKYLADGGDKNAADPLTKEDLPKLAQYMKDNNLGSDQYAMGLERYKREKRLTRT